MMTKTTILNAIASYINANGADMVFSADGDKTILGSDVMDFITKEKAALAKRNEKAKARNTEKKDAANAILVKEVRNILTEASAPMMAADVVAAMKADITTQKLARVITSMGNEVVRDTIKVEGKKRITYALNR